MFFIGIFGVDIKQKVLRRIPNLICNSCGRLTSYKLVKQYKFFHIFFIPIFKWGEQYYLLSDCCQSIFELTVEQGEALSEGKDYIIDSLNITINEENCNTNEVICYNCRKKVDSKYDFCPYCGSRLK